MPGFLSRETRRSKWLSLRLRFARHGRVIVSTTLLLVWLGGLLWGLPMVASSAEQDPVGFGLLLLFIAVASLMLAWCESDGS